MQPNSYLRSSWDKVVPKKTTRGIIFLMQLMHSLPGLHELALKIENRRKE